MLRLGDKRSDFYVLGAYIAAMAVAGNGLPPSAHTTQLPGVLTPPAHSVQGGVLLPAGGQDLPYIDGDVAGRHGFTVVTIRRGSGNVAEITTDGDMSASSRFSMVGDAVHVEKLEEFGIRALLLPDAWIAGTGMRVAVAQTGYPYDLFAASLSENHAAISLLNTAGLSEAFAGASESFHRVGLVALSVMKTMAEHASTDRLSVAFDYERFGIAEADASGYELVAGVISDTESCSPA
jgi:hypothetical protein